MITEYIVQNYLKDLKADEITEDLLRKAVEYDDENAEEALKRWAEEKKK